MAHQILREIQSLSTDLLCVELFSPLPLRNFSNTLDWNRWMLWEEAKPFA